MKKVFILLFSFVTFTCSAASFDCSRAKLPTEVTICSNLEISMLDEEMAHTYLLALKKEGGDKLKIEQRAWIKKRNNCGVDVSCLKSLYNARILELKKTSVIWSAQNWVNAVGKWTEADTTSIYGQFLIINKPSGEGFNFDLKAFSGSHTGEIDGFAQFTTDGALFKSHENDCQLKFLPQDDTTLSIETSGDCWYYGGMGVAFGGKFLKGNYEKILSLVDIEVLKTEHKDKIFRKLVGREYKDFIERFQLRFIDEKDLDGFNAKVISGAVRGMFTIMEAIIMDCPGDKIYAAMLKDDSVEYFTNDRSYAKRLPKTIETWRQRFSNVPVYFMSAQ
jgi:uncharacterized protein